MIKIIGTHNDGTEFVVVKDFLNELETTDSMMDMNLIVSHIYECYENGTNEVVFKFSRE
jgi:hypothetical protein